MKRLPGATIFFQNRNALKSPYLFFAGNLTFKKTSICLLAGSSNATSNAGYSEETSRIEDTAIIFASGDEKQAKAGSMLPMSFFQEPDLIKIMQNNERV